MLAGTRYGRNWIKAALMERMAAKYSLHRKPRTAHRTMALDGFHRELGTSGREAAGVRKHRREESLVAAEQK
jgi:hypothetical protein